MTISFSYTTDVRVLFRVTLFAAAVLISAAPRSRYRKASSQFLQRHSPHPPGSLPECHRPGEVAPMPLMTYEQTRAKAKAIGMVSEQDDAAVVCGPRFGHFSNDPSLTVAAIPTIAGLGQAGAPQATPTTRRPAAVDRGLEYSASPIVVLQMPKPVGDTSRR